jgi:hypothetical protein
MELEQELSNINTEISRLIMHKRLIQDKILKYRLSKILDITVEVNDFFEVPHDKSVHIYIDQVKLDVHIVKHYNTIYYKCIVDGKDTYNFTSKDNDLKNISDILPRFKEVFIDQINTWFYMIS